jgi:preprotein translocase subunit Sec61beta
MSSGNSSGLMSSAGLVRYFDSESSSAITIDPRTIVALAIGFGLLVRVASVLV